MAERISRSSSVADDEEVFEITDFTTVSDWEKFVAQISEAVSDWQLTCIENVKPLKKNELTSGSWEQVSKEIRFSNAVFMLTLYRLKQTGGEDIYFEESENTLEDELHLPAYMDDMMSTNNDFPPRAHCLVRWYGFRSFLVVALISTGSKSVEGLTSESKCNLLLSSACIVLSDSGCEVPIFIQIQQNWRKMFTGRCVGTGMQTEFEMVHLKKCPPQYQHLSGLLHVFKSKIGRMISPVQISARFTYVLSNWGNKGAWPQEQIDPDFAAQTLNKFQFGCLDDPISDLQLAALWPSITEDLIIENDVHSDFNPVVAPIWAIKLLYTDDPDCLLSGYLKEMIKLRTCIDTFSGLVRTTMKTQDGGQDISQALSKLTDSSHKVKQMVPLMPELTSGISKIVTTPRSMIAKRLKYAQYMTDGPISQNMMELIMEFLFPDEKGDGVEQSGDTASEVKQTTYEMEHQIKSAPENSLTYRLGTCLTVANYCHGGVSAIAQVWHEFVQELRYRFENGVLISGNESGNPDLRCCLLHQKLQMLNTCIQHKIKREHHQAQNLDSTQETEVLESSVQQDGAQEGEDEVTGSKEENSVDDEKAMVQSQANKDESPQLTESPEPDPRVDKVISRKESAVSVDSQSPPPSTGWRDEVSSIEDEFFDCDDGESDPSAELETKEDKAEGETQTSATENESVCREDDVESGGAKDIEHSIVEKVEPASNVDTVTDLPTVANEASQEDYAGTSSSTSDSIKNPTEDPPSSADIPTDPDLKPKGRLEEFEGKKLLHYDVPMFVPVTQEPAPLTEDILEEQTKIFSSLGDSAEGALLRRKMQSASLLSDMESFKAANPGCVLADFVRWYSPRDFEETEKDGKLSGSLSERMKIPGNLWQTMWNTAKPVTARRQKRLFDDTKEGEKVLHFLSSLQPKDLIILLLPICFHEAIRLLKENRDINLPSVPTLCEQILNQCHKLFQGPFKDKFDQMDDIYQKILFTETLIERAMSLKHKFAKVHGVDSFVRKLLENPEIALDGAANGNVGLIVKQYFLDQSNAALHQYTTDVEPPSKITTLPPPSGREYILRTTAPRPSAQSRPLPHRLYAVLIKNEFRLAGAFSSDTVFF